MKREEMTFKVELQLDYTHISGVVACLCASALFLGWSDEPHSDSPAAGALPFGISACGAKSADITEHCHVPTLEEFLRT